MLSRGQRCGKAEGVRQGEHGTIAVCGTFLEAANAEQLDTRRIYRLGIPDRYVEHGERSELLDALRLNAENLADVCRQLKTEP